MKPGASPPGTGYGHPFVSFLRLVGVEHRRCAISTSEWTLPAFRNYPAASWQLPVPGPMSLAVEAVSSPPGPAEALLAELRRRHPLLYDEAVARGQALWLGGR